MGAGRRLEGRSEFMNKTRRFLNQIDKITKVALGMGQPLVLPAGRLEKSKCEKKTDKFYFYIYERPFIAT